MARNSKRKLAIFAGTSKCLILAEAKYCASEMPGEIKYYECLKTEYCCTFGCCVSPGFHFHHWWYYWILAIIMFLVCSGGGWWYRYWLHGRYRAAASAIPSRSSNTRSQNSLRSAPCQAQQARITYNSARNTVLLHRMWKGPQRSTAAPAYNGSATTSTTHYQNMNVILNDANCPYYQLYGPPPSYETVIAQTRGKVGSPGSPAATATSMATATATAESSSASARLNHLQSPANVIPNPSIPQCFFYACSSPARLMDGGASQCHQGMLIGDNAADSVPSYAHYSQYCAANGAAIGQCVPLEYPSLGEPAAVAGAFARGYPASPQRPPGYPGFDAPDGHATLNVDAAIGGYAGASWCPAGEQSALKVHGRVAVQDTGARGAAADARTCTPKPEASGSRESDFFAMAVPVDATRRYFPRERTDYGGSLRLPRRSTAGAIVHRTDGFQRISFGDSSSCQRRVLGCARAADRAESADPPGRADASSSCQSNPSNNVILGSSIFEDARSPARDNAVEASGHGPRAMNRSTNFDPESKHKLDRSKSLD